VVVIVFEFVEFFALVALAGGVAAFTGL